jgi:hypothetical protein
MKTLALLINEMKPILLYEMNHEIGGVFHDVHIGGLLSRGLSLGYYGKVSSQLRYHRSLKETHNDIYSFSFYQKSQIADATNKLIPQVPGTCLP